MLVVSVEAIYEIDRDGRHSDARPTLAAARRPAGATVQAVAGLASACNRGSRPRQAA